MFGPCHVQTFSLAKRIAEALSGLGRHTIGASSPRTRRAAALPISWTHACHQNLRSEESDVQEAIAVQKEIAKCWLLLAGPEAPETTTARSDLGTLLMLHSESAIEN